MNPAGRGLDFTENPDAKKNLFRYAVDLHCLNPVADTTKTPLPPLEDLAQGDMAQLHAGLKYGSHPRKELDAILRTIGTQFDWYLGDKHLTCAQDVRLNKHIVAGGVMLTLCIQDP
jgi:hypothetical protein